MKLISGACHARIWTRSFLAVALAAVSAGAARAQLSFSDSLTGPSSPNLSIPAGKYGYTPSGLLRTQSDSGTTGSGSTAIDRPMIKTLSGAYLTTDFTAELTVTSSGNGDIIYFGFGAATPNAPYFNEPGNSIQFRIHNPPVWNGVHAAVDALSNPNVFNFIQQIGTYTNGPTRFRLVRSGDNVTLSIPSEGAGATATVSISQTAPFLNNSNGYIFFGNTSQGTTFSNLSVTTPTRITYSWVTGAFGACQFANNLCGAGTETRTVSCNGSDGSANNPASLCSGTAPASSQSCSVACTPAQLVELACPPTNAWKNHGQYVECVAKAADSLEDQRIIAEQQKHQFVEAAAHSQIGKHPGDKDDDDDGRGKGKGDDGHGKGKR